MKSEPVRHLVSDHRFRSASPVWLTASKAAHTIVWAFFVACIVAIPSAAWHGEHHVAGWMTAVVAGEVLVLAANGWRCPMTSVAGRFTAERRENFDIYLPVWLAKYNKLIFGALYIAGVLFASVHWVRASG
jgi:hypothetical protein